MCLSLLSPAHSSHEELMVTGTHKGLHCLTDRPAVGAAVMKAVTYHNLPVDGARWHMYISGTGWIETAGPAALQLDNIGFSVTVSLFWWSITVASRPTLHESKQGGDSAKNLIYLFISQ